MRLIFLLVVVTFLAACGNSELEPTSALLQVTEVGPSSDISTPAVEPTRTARPSDTPTTAVAELTEVYSTSPVETPTGSAQIAGEPVIILQQEGGYAGMMQTWAFYADGHILTEQNSSCRTEPESISDIQTMAEESGFFEMSFTKAPAICCDFFTYTLTIQSGDMVNTVVVSEGDPKMPQELRELIAFVQQTVSSCDG